MALYFIVGGGMTKVGSSGNVEKRLAHLRTMSPMPLRILKVEDGSYRLERAVYEVLHARGLHSHGEWFFGELTFEEAAEVVAEARKQEVRAVSAAEKGERPDCECHGVPMYWAASARHRHGGYWRCKVVHDSQRVG